MESDLWLVGYCEEEGNNSWLIYSYIFIGEWQRDKGEGRIIPFHHSLWYLLILLKDLGFFSVDLIENRSVRAGTQ